MRRKHQKHSLKAKTSDAFETDVVRSDSVSGTISASGHEIRNTKYEICKAHKFQKIGRGTYQSGVGAFLKSRRRIYQWKSLNLNFCRHMIWLRKILRNSNYLHPSSSSLKGDNSFETANIWICKVSESYLGDICWVGGIVDGEGGYSDFAELRKGKL